MNALVPGLYSATVKGVPDQIVMLAIRGDYGRVINTGELLTTYGSASVDLTDARPLITLDLHDYSPGNLAGLISAIDRAGHVTVAQSITQQTKPARIEEPSLWGVVKASWPDTLGPTCHWVRDEYGWTTHGGTTLPWGRLVNPVLIRAGVDS